MDYGVPNPSGKVNVQEIPIRTKTEVDDLRVFDIIIDDAKNLK